MASTLAHRGPDDSGVWADPAAGVAFGFRRLSILDLSPTGHQPMTSADGAVAIVFNGEIYNHDELRRELVDLGHRFRGRSDTEVIIEAVREWGIERTLPRLNGMFAIAIWNAETRRLWLARDRVGKKPLYYARAQGVWIFGSELKSLRAHPACPASLDAAAIALYLERGYIPAPLSVLEGVAKLPPGAFVELSQAADDATPRFYWRASDVWRRAAASARPGDPDDVVDRTDALLRDAVRCRMQADVPVGAFLSGGIDSSVVVALMQAESAAQVKTFTIAFDDPAFDEGAHARAVADHLGTSHTNFLVSPADAQAAVPDLAAIFDEPFGDSSAVPQLLVSRLARRHVTVALSGDGGDEVFAGYTRHLWADRVQRVSRKLPGVAREMVAGAFDSASPETWDRLYHRVRPYLPGRWRLSHPGEKLQKLAAAMRAPSAAALYETLAAPGMRGAMASPSAAAATLAPPSSSGSFVDYMLLRDLTEYLPDDILTKVDRATMAASLEARAPLLDYRVVEWGALIDPALRARDGRGKWVLRQVLARYVPPALFDRPKTGFALPVGQWLRGPLRDWAESLLSVRALAETDGIDADRVRDLWDAHLSGRRNLQAPLWIVLMLQAWHQRWRAPTPTQ